MTSLENSEVTYALSSCYFRQIQWQTFVSVGDLPGHLNSDAPTMTGTKLDAVIGTLLTTMPGSNDQVFFYHGAEIIRPIELPNMSADQSPPNDFRSDDVRNFSTEKDVVNDIESLEEDETNFHPDSGNPPLFFRFTLDKKLASMTDILALKKSAILAAEVSVFDSSERKLPPSHVAVVSKLQNALNSFTSEQTLEKYRFVGRSLTQEILEEVIDNLPKTKHKSHEIPLDFYISRSNSLIAADNPTGNVLGQFA